MTCDPFPLLPTPNASVAQDGEKPETWFARREKLKAKGYNGNGAGLPLTIAVQLLPLSSPGSVDSTLPANGSSGPNPSGSANPTRTVEPSSSVTGPGFRVCPTCGRSTPGSDPSTCCTAAIRASRSPRRDNGEEPTTRVICGPSSPDAFAFYDPESSCLRTCQDTLLSGSPPFSVILPALGFDAEWVVVRASDVGAPHRRARLFVVAWDAERGGRDGWPPVPWREPKPRAAVEGAGGAAADSGSERHDGRRGGDPRGAAGERNGRPGAQGHRTPAADPDEHGLESVGRLNTGRGDVDGRGGTHTAWGAYEPAIRRWERITRPAPRPTDDRGRLMPEFVEWMMGFPDGWTAGQSRTARLRMLGNAVVPAQAVLALAHLDDGGDR